MKTINYKQGVTVPTAVLGLRNLRQEDREFWASLGYEESIS